MSAVAAPTTKSSAKPFYLVAAVFVAALVVIALAISAWATTDGSARTSPTRFSPSPSPQSVNALSPELQSVNVAPTPSHVSHAEPSVESLNALSPELQSVNVSPTPPHAGAIVRSATAAECRMTGPC